MVDRDTQERRPGRIGKRKACDNCRASKTRCDSLRPTCSTCRIFNKKCAYAQLIHSQGASRLATRSRCTSSQDFLGITNLQYYAVQQMAQPIQGAPSSDSLISVPAEWLQSDLAPLPWNDLMQTSQDASVDQDMPLYLDTSNDFVTDSVDSLFGQCPDLMNAERCEETEYAMALIRAGAPWDVIHTALKSDGESVTQLAALLHTYQSPPEENTSVKSEISSSDTALKVDLELPSMNDQTKASPGLGETVSKQESVPPLLGASSIASKPASDYVHVQASNILQSLNDKQKWSMLPLQQSHEQPDCFDQALRTLQHDIAAGADHARICGSHAYIGALFHERHYKSAPKLSRIIVDQLKQLRPDELVPTPVTIAIMWLHWSFGRWMLAPTLDNYTDLPDIMKPAVWQLALPHRLACDFLITSDLRDRMSQTVGQDWRALQDVYQHAKFSWPKTSLHGVCSNRETGQIDVTPNFKAHAEDPRNWSFELPTK